MKNVFAIFMGFLNYQENSINTQSSFFIEILNEIKKYLKSKNLDINNLITHSALGDIFLTCISNKSRNFSFGYNIAQYGIEKAINENQTVEGLTTINNLREIFLNNDEYPFLKNLIQLIDNNISNEKFVNQIWKELVNKNK